MNKLEKKQIPQFAALCVLSAGLFGYFVVRLITPSPAAAGTRPAQTPPTAPPAAAKPAPDGKAKPAVDAPAKDSKAALTPDTPSTDEDASVPPPTPGMHDPFVIGYVDPSTLPTTHGAPALPTSPGKVAEQVASLPPTTPAFLNAPAPLNLKGFPVQPLPSAPSLPAASAIPTASMVHAVPAPPAPPAWTVTGVLQSDGQQVAILRSGAARRIVRTGDFVDSVYRVIGVTRTSVVLRHGSARYPLLLGAVQDAPAKSGFAKSGFAKSGFAKSASIPEKPEPSAPPTAVPSMAQLQKDADTAAEAAKPNDFNF